MYTYTRVCWSMFKHTYLPIKNQTFMPETWLDHEDTNRTHAARLIRGGNSCTISQLCLWINVNQEAPEEWSQQFLKIIKNVFKCLFYFYMPKNYSWLKLCALNRHLNKQLQTSYKHLNNTRLKNSYTQPQIHQQPWPYISPTVVF